VEEEIEKMDYLKLIEKINQDLYEKIPDDSDFNHRVTSFIEENPPLKFISSGYAHCINFFGMQIWSSENDERPYENEEEDIYIPLEDWIWQEINRVLGLMSWLNAIVIASNKPTTPLSERNNPMV